MSTSDHTAGEPRSMLRCAECDAGLAHDQRYCVQCGARRGPLPAEIAGLVGAIHEQGPEPDLPPGTPLADSFAGNGPRAPAFGFAMPGPRAAAAAVMAMLGFGVIVGSLVGGTSVVTLASAPLIVVGMDHPAATPAAQTVVVAQSGGGGGGGGGGAGGGGAAAAAGSSAAAAQNEVPASETPAISPTSTTGTETTSAGLNGLPPVKHVFMIVLSDRGFTQSFGSTSSAGYLAGSLRREGELVQNYYAVAGSPLANEIALVSGQGPTAQNAADCPVFSHIKHATKGPRGQVVGNGCAYPSATKTLASELTHAGDTWKAYVQGVSSSAKSACRVPTIGSKVAQGATAKNTYLAWRNPFLYFTSLTSGSACHKDEVGLGQLKTDLKSSSTTPTLAYIIPAPCSDGSEAACKPNAKPGLAGANEFLKAVVPEIKKSPAYTDGGMIVVTFDQAPQSGQYADPSACCSSPTSYPNLRGLPAGAPAVPAGAMGPAALGTTTGTSSGTTTTTPVSLGSGETTPTGGGGQVGLLLISPYVKANSTDVVDYFNHFSLLGTIENMFGLHRLGYSDAPGLPLFSTGVFNKYAG
jgi:phosphatidylinositol-3-phosphatase